MKKLAGFAFFMALTVAGISQEVIRVTNGAAVTIQSNAPVTIGGDVLLQNGSWLVNHGAITMKGNWVDETATGYHHGMGALIFNSVSPQTIHTKNQFERIDINTAGLTLASDVQSNKWWFVTGKVTTGSFKAIAMTGVEADATNPNFANSYVNGLLRRYVNTASVNSYSFPVGNAALAHVAIMENLTADPLTNLSYIDAFFAPKTGTDLGLSVVEAGSLYTGIHDAGVWHLVPDVTPGSGRYDLRVFTNGFGALMNNQFTILRRPEGSVNASDWKVPTGSSVNAHGGPGRLVADGYALRKNIPSFSEFGIGILNVPLPVRLTHFDAMRVDRSIVRLNWQTESEQNNAGFFVELRKDNEVDFVSKGFVKSMAADGNHIGPLYYSFTDANGYAGISYYRLQQTDRDGMFSYSLIKAVKGASDASVSVWVGPNPSTGRINIRMENVDGVKDAFLYDMKGVLVQQFKVQNQVVVNQLPAGTYVLTIRDVFGSGLHFRQQVVIIH